MPCAMTIPKRWSFSKSTLVRLIPAQIGLRTTVTSSLSCGVPGISSWRISSFSKTPKNLLTSKKLFGNLSLSVREKNKRREKMLNLTKKEREMIAVFFACGYDNECYTCHLCFSHADNAVLASLIKKGVFKHNGLRGKCSTCLSDS